MTIHEVALKIERKHNYADIVMLEHVKGSGGWTWNYRLDNDNEIRVYDYREESLKAREEESKKIQK